MANIDMKDLTQAVRDKMDKQNINPHQIAIAARLSYSTVCDALRIDRVPKLDTVQILLRALGFEFSEILEPSVNTLHLSDEEDYQFRKYRKLRPENQQIIWKVIDSMLALQREEDLEWYKKEKGSKTRRSSKKNTKKEKK
ncbi:MAG: hypothetical protein J6O61_14195 [Butyrivibrio sp.]|uniref:hypothetical protein n=1 Tax=Butyrivibrio sp. TaxID=28121 RepID=UPI001B161748|nr:hypothetical protein [Butyrivibrio sp.]MBO6241952.1 hypothetical protein [Butyrivibrio sp.]